MATQFLWTVSSSMQVINRRPCNDPSPEQIHLYTLQTQIIDSAKVGQDAGKCMYTKYGDNHVCTGFLQILFLAGATGHLIQQHCSQQGQELYNLLVSPCSCLETVKPKLNVMWVNFSGHLATYNHLIPLISK